MTPQKNKREVYNNGFKSYYYKCECCGSENVAQVPSGGFSPPNLVCNSCQKSVKNNPITIEYLGEKEMKHILKEATKRTTCASERMGFITAIEWQKEVALNRLKEQYKKYKQNYNNGKTILKESYEYFAMRLFCLDTQLVSFNDIELMEFEVNQSFS